jgi:hypothetical protein
MSPVFSNPRKVQAGFHGLDRLKIRWTIVVTTGDMIGGFPSTIAAAVQRRPDGARRFDVLAAIANGFALKRPQFQVLMRRGGNHGFAGPLADAGCAEDCLESSSGWKLQINVAETLYP